MPDEWELPDELLRPSSSVEMNLAIAMLSCDSLGHEARTLVGRFVSENSLYALWFLKFGKRGAVNVTEALRLAGVPMEQAGQIYPYWSRFRATLDSAAPDGATTVRRMRSELEHALLRAVEVLEGARDGEAGGGAAE